MSARTLPLLDKRNDSLIENIRIGFNAGNMAENGDVVRKRTGDIRGNVKQDRYRRVLKQHGYDMTLRSEDADHVLDLGFEGKDSYHNMWPLDSVINRRGFNSFPWVRIVQISRTGRAEVRQMMTMGNKYFRIIGHGINRGIVGRDKIIK